MAVHAELRIERRETLIGTGGGLAVGTRKAVIALVSGLAGGVAMALPLVLYDWANAGHSALELFMAPTAWLFGLSHFAQNGYLWWPIVVGLVVLTACWALLGMLFEGIADRVDLRTLPATLGAGLGWGFVAWLFVWYTLLPIARGGAPFHAAAASSLFVAPIWVFVLGFALLGVATSLTYRLMRRE